MITKIKNQDHKRIFTHRETGDKEYTMLYFDNDLRTCILRELESKHRKMANFDNIKMV